MLTILDPATSKALTTIETVKAELRLTGGAEDNYLEALIKQASAVVQNWCGRTFATEGVRETLQVPHHAECAVLARWPVVTIASVTFNGDAVDPSEYECDFDTGRIYRLSSQGVRTCWPCARLVIDYSAGYALPDADSPTLPEDIERAAVLLVKADYLTRARDPFIKAEEVTGVGRVEYWVGGFSSGSSLLPEAEGLLSRHRNVSLG